MTQAARQCREYIEEKYQGVRISRFACRDTAKGEISQHSAYEGYDSNALDVFGPLSMTILERREFIQEIVDDLTPNLYEWSIRKIIWTGGRHKNHAHIDFYPMITIHKWCGGPETPTWRYSDDSTVKTRDPLPENGLYQGEILMPKEQWHQMIRTLFDARPDEFDGDPEWWIALDPDDPQWETHFWPAFGRVIT